MAAAIAWERAMRRSRRPGAAAGPRVSRPKWSPGSPISVIRHGQDSDRGRLPGQKHRSSRLHAGARLARDLDLQHVVADGDVELERVTVIADVLDDAGERRLRFDLSP